MPSIIKVDQIQSDTGRTNVSNVSINSTVGNVNIGFATQSSAQPFLNILSSNGAIPGSGTDGLVLSNGRSLAQIKTYASSTGWVLLQHHYNGSEIGGISMPAGGVTDSITFRTTNTQAGTSAGAFLGKSGITFPATQVASSDANTLDDYEEGSWTPSFGGITSAVYGYQLGTYTKIGNMVYCFWDMQLNSRSGTFDSLLNGFPFAVSGSLAGYSVLHHRDASALSSSHSDGQLKGFIQQGATYGVYQVDRSGTSGFGTSVSASTPSLSTGRSTGYVIYQTST